MSSCATIRVSVAILAQGGDFTVPAISPFVILPLSFLAADGLSFFGSAWQLAYRELHRSSTN
jgi:hypothetical protein